MEETMDTNAMDLLQAFASQLPWLVPMLAGLGIAFALVLRRRPALGAAATPALAGLGLLLASLLLSTVWYMLAPALLTSSATTAVLPYLFAVSSLLFSTLNAAGIVLLVLAVLRRPG